MGFGRKEKEEEINFSGGPSIKRPGGVRDPFEQSEIPRRVLEPSQTEKVATILDTEVKKSKLSVSQGDRVRQKVSTDPSSLVDAVAKNELKRNEGGTPSVKDNFMEAFTFFLPQLGGLAIGGAIAGTEGAIAGSETAGALGASFREHQLKKEELKLKKDRTRKAGGITAFQKESLKLRAQELEQDERRFTEISKPGLKLRGKKLALSADQLGLTKKKAAQLSDKQVDQFSDMDKVLGSVARIEELRKKVNTGPLAGRVQSLAQLAGAAPRRFNKIKAETTNTLAAYVKSISGAAVSELEAQRLQGIIPDVNDSPSVFEDKLETFERIVRENKLAFAKSITSGQPLKAGTIKGLIEAENKYKKGKKIKGINVQSQLDMIKRIKARRNK